MHGILHGDRESVIPGKKRVNKEKGPQAPLHLSHRVLQTGEVAVEIAGELDMATADTAFSYVRKIIDSHCGPVIVGLAGVRFCDARGLHALLRMASHAEQAGCPFRLTSPSPMLTKLMRITGLSDNFPAAT